MITSLLLVDRDAGFPDQGQGVLLSREIPDEEILAGIQEAKQTVTTAREEFQRTGKLEAASTTRSTDSDVDILRRMAARIEMTGVRAPLTTISFSYPRSLRLGDEATIGLTVECRHCKESQLRVDFVSDGVAVNPTSVVRSVRGDVTSAFEVMISAKSLGTKAVVINATSLPSNEPFRPGSFSVEVLPPSRVLGIPEPYLEFARTVSAAIGLPALVAAIFGYWLVRRRRAEPRRPPAGFE